MNVDGKIILDNPREAKVFTLLDTTLRVNDLK